MFLNSVLHKVIHWLKKPVLIYQTSENLTDDEDQIKLKNWIEKRLNKSNVEVYK